MRAASNSKKKEYAFIATLLILAFFLRIYNSGGLTGGDDSQYALYSHYVLNGETTVFYPRIPDIPVSDSGVLEARPFAVLPPVISTYIFGYNSFAIQFPSALFAALSVLVIYLILRRFFGRPVTWTATFLLAINPFHIAFTKLGVNDGLLTLLTLSITLFVIKGIQENRCWYFYLAGLLGVVNMLTTNFRGIVPLAALLPLVVLMRPKKKMIKHMAVVVLISGSVWLLYYIIPFLWGDSSVWEYLVMRVFHAAKRHESKVFFPFFKSLKIIGMYQYLTPFLGFITVPAIFGIAFAIKKIKNPVYALWVVWAASSLVIYWQGQPYPNRHAIITPAIIVLASIGLWNSITYFVKCRKKDWRTYIFPALMFLTASYILLIFKLFPKTFSREWESITASMQGSILLTIYSLFDKIFWALIAAIFLITILWIVSTIHYRQSKRTKKKISKYIIYSFLAINLLLIFGLVITGVARYHRPDEIETISSYIKNNMGDAEYSCIALLESRTVTYYTQKPCAHFSLVDLDWIKERVSEGELKYFVEDIYYTGGHQYLSEGADVKILFPETYVWIMNNTIDITPETGVDPNNPYFRLHEFI